jgi:hypothetical protein
MRQFPSASEKKRSPLILFAELNRIGVEGAVQFSGLLCLVIIIKGYVVAGF